MHPLSVNLPVPTTCCTHLCWCTPMYTYTHAQSRPQGFCQQRHERSTHARFTQQRSQQLWRTRVLLQAAQLPADTLHHIVRVGTHQLLQARRVPRVPADAVKGPCRCRGHQGARVSQALQQWQECCAQKLAAACAEGRARASCHSANAVDEATQQQCVGAQDLHARKAVRQQTGRLSIRCSCCTEQAHFAATKKRESRNVNNLQAAFEFSSDEGKVQSA